MQQAPTITLFFDGACPLCSREAKVYRQRLPPATLGLVDIAASDFRAADFGLDAKAVHATIHAKLADGTVLTGIDAFAAIWRQIPRMRPLAALTGVPVVRQAMQLGYAAFAKVRPRLPGRRCASSC